MADDAQHLRDLGIVGSDVALDEGVVVFEVAQGRRVGLAHDGRPEMADKGRTCVPHVGRPSVLLPESLETRLRFVPLRRRIQPLSPECLRVMVWGLSDYGRCVFGSGVPFAEPSASPTKRYRADYTGAADQ
ncbi:hypothetical protein GCM10008098_12460 [Rhodanobacter panaciterrae]|uniref:Uncharacterized protein n=1 Tax=Rhodanobacter panaciterrae TaxID=490572 RepID=A0ABQ2ZND3_9GAMM|nr:hypothetical protein GCM10008098_12460 [Rhodanobacter panaciterrae]